MTDSFRLYGIFGYPLAHTLSPVMQEAAFSARGGPASGGRALNKRKAFYLLFEVRKEEFRRLMRERSRLLLDGFNVTVPYKEEVLRYLDGTSPSARAIGAVNTVVRKGKRWIGFNTDEVGFMTSLREEGKFDARGKQVLILGAGGSARAVAYALARRGARQIVITNRTITRSRKMVSEYRQLFPRVEFLGVPLASLRAPRSGAKQSRMRLRSLSRAEIASSRRIAAGLAMTARDLAPRNDDIDLVVNATSVGLKAGDPSLVSPKDFPRKTLFVDLIYNPSETRFLRLARESGHRTLNGLGMLVSQGAEAFRLWTGRKAPVEVMRRAVIGRRPPISTGGRLLIRRTPA